MTELAVLTIVIYKKRKKFINLVIENIKKEVFNPKNQIYRSFRPPVST